MAVSAREILAGVLAVQKNVLTPEAMAQAVSEGRSPGERLGAEWDALTDQAEDRLAAAKPLPPGAPAGPRPARRSGGGGPALLLAAIGLAVLCAGLGVGLLMLLSSRSALQTQRDALAVSQEEAVRREADARVQLDLADKTLGDLRALAEDPKVRQPQHAEVKRLMLEKMLPYLERPGKGKADAREAERAFALGFVRNELGDHAGAEDPLREARDAYGKLAEAGDKGHRLAHARSLAELGRAQQAKRGDDSRHAFEAARKAYKEIDPHHPGVAAAEVGIGDARRAKRMDKEAMSHYDAAREVYAALLKKDAKSAAHRDSLAAVYLSLAVVSPAAHSQKAAHEYAEQAREIRETLAKADPKHTTYRAGLAEVRVATAELYLGEGDRAKAAVELGAAEALRKALADEYPGAAGFGLALADVRRRVGDLRREAGEADEASKAYQSSRELYARWGSKEPASALGLARAERGVGLLAVAKGDHAEGRKRFETAEALLDPVAKGSADALAELAANQNDLGQAAVETKDAEAAAKHFAQARAEWRKLTGDGDRAAEAFAGVARACVRLASLAGEKQRDEAEAALAGAFEALDKLRLVEPKSARLNRLQSEACARRAPMRMSANQFAEAARDWDVAASGEPDLTRRWSYRLKRQTCMLKVNEEDPRLWVESARILALKGSMEQADTTKEPAERAKLAEAKYDEAMENLQGAETRGVPKTELAAHAKADAEFAPLRGREDFKIWLAELEKK